VTRTTWTAITAAAVTAVVLHQARLLDLDQPASDVIRDGVLSAVVLGSGVLVGTRGGRARMGLLIVAWAIASLLTDLWFLFPDSTFVASVLAPLIYIDAAVYVHMVLAYPTGRVLDRLDRIGVWTAYCVALLAGAVPSLTWDPSGCAACAPSVRSWFWIEGTNHVLWLDVGKSLLILVGLVFIGLLVRRIVRAPRGSRRRLWPLAVAGVAAAVTYVVHLGFEIAEAWSVIPVLDWIALSTSVTVPLALAAGVMLSARARRGVADLVVDLSVARPGHVRDALADAVGDPSLELALWDPSGRRWIDPDGLPVELPTGPSRTVTFVGTDLAAVIHDPALVDQRRLVASAGSAARLALENERLQAELRAQLQELRASRARIVTVGDDERRRLERDLHDGAQQRLLGVGLALQLLRPRLGSEGDAEPVLAEAEEELQAALAELRELARGIHPAVLTEQGLEPALRSLARRAVVPVHVTAEPSDLAALPVPVQTAMYFVAAEALANISKHAQASGAWLTVTRSNGAVSLVVRDDGRGGADGRTGSGLVGLGDRVGALGGSLTVTSEPGTGTILEAVVPCGS
jgi:signal transduction histidine kinase